MTGRKLRSQERFGGPDKGACIHRSWKKNQGFAPHLFESRPVIGICNAWSELTPCNGGLGDLAAQVKRGVYEAGGFPVEFSIMSTGESNMRPTAMMFCAAPPVIGTGGAFHGPYSAGR